MPPEPRPQATDTAAAGQPAWQHLQPVPLAPALARLTAPNASRMTGPGTNSYLLGDAARGFCVIDPGPADPGHVQRLWQACAGAVRLIVCTHSHTDHAPGAYLLQALCRQHDAARVPPIWGWPSAATAKPGSAFVPDCACVDGQTLAWGTAPGVTALQLQAVHTPGHAANHICLLWAEGGALFSGDHILQGSTPVIDPPDGDMSAYLDSLTRLARTCAAAGVHTIWPAHGHGLPEPLQVIERLRRHRLQREARVRAAMQAQPEGGLDDWLAQAYADVEPALWPLARRSLLAHVLRLQQLHPCAGGVGAVGAQWPRPNTW